MKSEVFRSVATGYLADISRDIRTPMNAITGMINLLLDTDLDAEQRSYANTAARAADNLHDRLNEMGDSPGGVVNSEGVSPLDLKGLRLLVVDENEATAKNTEQQMLARNIDVDIAFSGAEAVDILISAARNLFPFDMVVVDHAGARGPVIDLARKIKKNNEIGDISLMMISSAMADENDQDEIEAAGFDGFLSRPVGAAEMIHLMAVIWSARQRGQKLAFMTRKQLRQHRRQASPCQVDINYGGIEVLLAEDNGVNRMVAGKILDKYGFTVTLATTGRAAVEQVRKKTFDIILMDCHMPEMDGYEATRMIHNYEKEHDLKHVPVIAFTASAIAGDHVICLAAGMDDYIPKPVQPENMIDIMSRWLTASLAEKARKARIREHQQRNILIDRDILDALRSLTGEKFVVILESYIRTTGDMIFAIQEAIRSQDALTLRNIAPGVHHANSRAIGGR